MRKGLSISVVAGVILALVGVALLVNVYLNTLSGEGGGMFCLMYDSIGFVFPGDLPPTGCGGGGQQEVRAVRGNREELEDQLIAGILDCYKRYEGRLSDEEVCAGWILEEITDDDHISNDNIQSKIEDNNFCEPIFGESDCWNDYIDFDNDLDEGDYVLVMYRYDETDDQEKIVVE